MTTRSRRPSGVAHRVAAGRGARPAALLLSLVTVALAVLLVPGPEDRPPLPGRLAFIGADGNVYVTRPGVLAPLQVTYDATAPPEGDGLSYHRIAWSTGGSLAFAAVERTGSRASGRLYVSDTLTGTPRLVAQDPAHFYIYTYWSPARCSEAANSPNRGTGSGAPRWCRSALAYLIGHDDAVALHLLDLENHAVADRIVANGRPFYLSWAPDGTRIVWHSGDRLAVHHLATQHTRSTPASSPTFRTPTWSPRGDRWLGVVRNDGTDLLTSFSEVNAAPLLRFHAAEIAFSWAPDGSSVAYAVREQEGDPFYSPIYLLNPGTGEAARLTPAPFRCLAFFWSPDGTRIAYLNWLDLPGVTWAQWRVIDVVTGEDRGFAAFRPTPLMQFALHSFDQYAHTHRFWSPDGRYLVYAERDERGADTIWLVDTRAAPGTEPIFVASGPLAYWSFH